MPAARVPRLIQLVADYGPGELAFSETVQWLALAAPDSPVCATRVAAGDTLAAGLCVAELALGGGPGGRAVVHDVDGTPRDRRQWIGRTRGGALVVGADYGWAWSFITAPSDRAVRARRARGRARGACRSPRAVEASAYGAR